jgi:hypothetical protein
MRLWGFALLSLPLSPLSHNQAFGILITPHYAEGHSKTSETCDPPGTFTLHENVHENRKRW